MSVKQMGLVWELDLPANKKFVLLAYADHADHDGGSVYPSLGRIAYKTGYSRRQVIRLAQELVADGLMQRVRDATHDAPAEYQLYPERGDKLPPLQKRGVTSVQGRGDMVSPEPSVEPSVNDKSNDLSANGEADKQPSPMPMGQYGIKELTERVKAAQSRGTQIYTTTDRERRSFGEMFKQAAEDGHEVDDLLLALDYMVAKASGEVDGEPKAWCGFRTALDKVMEGWRPKGATVVSSERLEEIRKMREESARVLQEAGA